LPLLADPDLALVEVDVLPPESDDLPTTEAERDGEHERGVERISPSRSEEGERLVQAPGIEAAGLDPRRVDESDDVPGDQLLAAGGRESRAKNLVGLLRGSRGGLLFQPGKEAADVSDAQCLADRRSGRT
jgi:predicted component of type VI protein secretion system